MRRTLTAILLTASVVALTGCTAPGDPASDGELRVVASTNVYGDLAASIAGPGAVVTSIIDDPSADPHGYEASPRVQLDLAQADVVIANGGGYDDFVDEMLEASGNTTAVVLHAVDFANFDTDANEHVWYDYATMATLVLAIGDALDDAAADPDFRTRAIALHDDILALAGRAHVLEGAYAGEGVVITEPVPLYLLEAAGLVDLTPAEFSEAIEEDVDVPPALLQRVLTLIPSASVVVVNAQTGGPQTDAVLDVAGDSGVPFFAVTETLPAGLTYVEWQSGVIDLLEGALAR